MRGRPRKIRFVRKKPRVLKFSPRGIRGRPDVVTLQIEDVEAIRLANLDNVKHRDAAKLMGISRQTFERMLKKAHYLLADGIVKGKIIKIEGGSYKSLD